MFPGYECAYDMNQFLENQFVIAIPINPTAAMGDRLTDSSVL